MTEDEKQDEQRERKALHLPPIKLHTQEVEGHLGGHEWSHAFASYIGSVLPIQTRQERDQWLHTWWTIPYVIHELVQALGKAATDALLAWKMGKVSYHAACRYYRQPADWLQQQYQEAKQIVRALRPPLFALDTAA